MAPKVLWAPSNPGRAQYLNPSDIGLGASSVGNTYTYRPGETNPQGNVYSSWTSLIAAYQQEVLETPTRAKTISFDDSLASISIPHIPGLQFTSLTSFSSAIPGRVVPVQVQNDTKWQILPDLNLQASFQSASINWTRLAGPSADTWIQEAPAAGTIKMVFRLGQTLIRNESVLTEAYIPSGLIDFDLDAIESEITAADGSPGVFQVPAAVAQIKSRLKSVIGYNVFSSSGLLASLTSRVDADSTLGSQPALVSPANVELNGPAASLNVRPGPNYVVLCRDQLVLTGPQDTPQILQGFLFGLTANPTNGDAFVITDGTTSETFTFKAVPAAPFEVNIGANRVLTLISLANTITADSTQWKAALVQNPITDQVGVAIIRNVQAQEFYADRCFALAPFASGSPFVGSFRSSQGVVKLSYAQPDYFALPLTDLGYSFAGFSTVSPLADGTLISVVDGLSDGIYQALNAIGGAGKGTWQYMCSPSDPTLAVSGSGTTAVTRQTRLIVATLAAADNHTLALPSYFPVGVPLLVRRADVTAGTLTLDPVTGTINGLASVPLAAASGGIYACDGTNWFTLAKT